MRKRFFSLIGLFLLTCVFTGCGESAKEAQAQKEAAEKARQDSINAAIAQAKADSIEKARQDSLEQVLIVEHTIVFITEFYKKYLTLTTKDGGNGDKLQPVVKDYCTKNLYNEWHEGMTNLAKWYEASNRDPENFDQARPCDYDMIINETFCGGGGGAIDVQQYKNLQVKSLGGDSFEVDFRLTGEVGYGHVYDEKKTLRIKVTEENDVTKISEIKDLTPG